MPLGDVFTGLAGHSSGKDWIRDFRGGMGQGWNPPRFTLFSTPEVRNRIVPFPFGQNNLSPLALRDDPARIAQKKGNARIIREGFAVFCGVRGRLNLPARVGFLCCFHAFDGFPRVAPSVTKGAKAGEPFKRGQRSQKHPFALCPWPSGRQCSREGLESVNRSRPRLLLANPERIREACQRKRPLQHCPRFSG